MQSCCQAARRISVETRHWLFGSRYRGVEVAPERLWGKRCLWRTLLRFVLNLYPAAKLRRAPSHQSPFRQLTFVSAVVKMLVCSSNFPQKKGKPKKKQLLCQAELQGSGPRVKPPNWPPYDNITKVIVSNIFPQIYFYVFPLDNNKFVDISCLWKADRITDELFYKLFDQSGFSLLTAALQRTVDFFCCNLHEV